jgi:hypothetical protein
MASKNFNPQDELHLGHRYEYVKAISVRDKGRIRIVTKGYTHVPDGIQISCPMKERSDYPIGSLFKCYNVLVTKKNHHENKFLHCTNLLFIQKP